MFKEKQINNSSYDKFVLKSVNGLNSGVISYKM